MAEKGYVGTRGVGGFGTSGLSSVCTARGDDTAGMFTRSYSGGPW